jgi:predicted transcriptional regulator
MLLSLIANLVKAISAYLELKNKSFYYDILEKSRSRQAQLAHTIEELRAEGTNDSNDIADAVFLQLTAEQKYCKHLSATYSPIESKAADSNK